MASSIVARLVLKAGEFQRGLQQAEQGVQAFGGKLRKIGTLGNTIVGAAVFASVTKGFQDIIQAAQEFETAFAGVKKTVNATAEEFATLSSNFTQLSTTVPVSREDLSKIGEIAGQLGVSGVANITKFTETIARIATSTNLSTDVAATQFARFANITGLPLEKVDRLGAAIVDLGNNFATTEAEITAMALRLAGAATAADVGEADILGIATALTALGVNAEAGGTAFSKLFIQFSAAAAKGGKEAEAFAEQVGLTVEGFQQLVKDSPTTALTTFIGSLQTSKDAGENLFGILEKLGLGETRLRDAILRTAGAGDLVEQAVGKSNAAFAANTALVEESEKRFATTESKVKVLSNTLSVLSGEVGTVLLPAIKDLAELLVPMVREVIAWAKENPNLVKSLTAMAGVVGVGGALVVGIGALGAAIGLLGTAGGPVLLAAGAVAGLVGAVVGLKDKIGPAIESMRAGVMDFFDRLAKGLAGGADAVVDAVADMLNSINDFLNTFPQRAFKSGVALVDEFAKGLASGAQRAVDAVGEMVGQVRKFLPFSPAKEGPLKDLDQSGVALGKTFAEGIREGADAPVDAVSAVAERIKQELDVRGSIPTRNADGRFNAAVARTGDTLTQGLDASLTAFVERSRDIFAQGVQLADAAARSMGEAFGTFFFDVFQAKFQSFKDVLGGLRELAVSVLRDITQEIARTLAVKTTGAIVGAALGALGGGGTLTPGFATGGSFVVGGHPGIDSNLVRFRATRGERVTVETPEQVRAREGGARPVINIINHSGQGVETRESTAPSGGVQIDVMIGRMQAGDIRKRGPLAQALEQQYGLKRVGGVR